MKALQFLKSTAFMFYACIATVVFLAPNSYFVYHSFSMFTEGWKIVASAGVSVIIASGIMIFTARRNEKVAMLFAYFEAGIAIYYYIISIGWDWGLIPAFGFALILPYSVKMYANELIKDDIEASTKAVEQPPTELITEQVKHDLKIFMDENPTKRPEDFFRK